MRTRLAASLLSLVGAAVLASAQPHPVQTRLILDPSDPAENRTARVGVLFDIEAGWHIYWKNPGDSGLATAVDLELPDGFEAGPILWPTPVSFDQPGGIAGYGYERSVLLSREIGVVAATDAGDLDIVVNASWLACKDRCLQGEAVLKGRLDQGAPAASARQIFASWNRALPLSGDAVKQAMHLSSRAGVSVDELILLIAWARPPSQVEFFPDPGDSLRISQLSTRTRGGLTRVDLTYRFVGRASSSNSHNLNAVVVATHQDGQRQGFAITPEITP